MSDSQRFRMRAKYLTEWVEALTGKKGIDEWHVEDIRDEIEKAKKDVSRRGGDLIPIAWPEEKDSKLEGWQ